MSFPVHTPGPPVATASANGTASSAAASRSSNGTPGVNSAVSVSLTSPNTPGGGPAFKKHRHEDEEQGKLFVGGLSWDTNQESLLRYFARFGEVIDCVVMKNSETGRSRGFGFVTFSDPNNIDAVISSGPHNLDGRTIDPKACNPRSMQKPKRGTNQQYPKVFLGGLPTAITETDLRSFFGRFGEVMEVVIMYDQEKKKSRGFGFLSFADDAACGRAVAEHFVNIQNKQVEIKRAEPRTNPPSSLASSDPISTASSTSSVKDLHAVAAVPHHVDQWAASLPHSAAPNGHAAPPPPHGHAPHHPHAHPHHPPPAPHHPPPAATYSTWGAPPPGSTTPSVANGPPPPPPHVTAHAPPAAYPAQYGGPGATAPGAPGAPAPWGSPPNNGPPPQWVTPSYTSPPPSGHSAPPHGSGPPPPPTQYPPPPGQAHPPSSAVYAPAAPSTPQPPPAAPNYWTGAPSVSGASDPYVKGEYSYALPPGGTVPISTPYSFSGAGSKSAQEPTYTNSGNYYHPAPSPVAPNPAATGPPPPHGYPPTEVVGGPQRGAVSYGAQPPPYHPYRRGN